MRTFASVLLLGLTVLSSCGATLPARGTAPTQLNDGACTSPVLSSAASSQRIHAQVLGTSLEDSLTVMPGAAFSFSWQVPAGSYQVRVWASIAARPELVGCDTTVTIEAPAKPAKPRMQ